MNSEAMKKAEAIIASKTGGGNESYCTLAQIDLDGFPTAATISVSRAEGINWITFCSGLESNWAKCARADNRSCVCFNSAAYNISLVGTMEIITDPDVKKEMWYPGMEEHFSGPEAPGYCVFKFTAKRYSILLLKENLYEQGTLGKGEAE